MGAAWKMCLELELANNACWKSEKVEQHRSLTAEAGAAKGLDNNYALRNSDRHRLLTKDTDDLTCH